MADYPYSALSGIPPEAWLSGLNLGSGGIVPGIPGLSGSGAVSDPRITGAQGGLSLDELNALLAGTQDLSAPGPASGGNLFAPLGGTLGQPGYSLAGGGTGSTGQGGGGQGYTMAGATGGGIDPLLLIKQALGFTQKGLGLADAFTRAQETDGSGTGAYQATGTPTGQTVDATGYSLYPQESGASPTSGLESILGPNPLLGETLLGSLPELLPDLLLKTKGVFEGPVGDYFTQLPAPEQARFLSAMLTGDVDTSAIDASNFGFGTTQTGFAPGTAPQAGSEFGAAAGGVGALTGALGLATGIQSGNVPATIGGAGQTLSGLTAMLQQSPELAQSLGISGQALGAAGGLSGLAGGLLGLYGGSQALANEQPVQGITGLGLGGLAAYNSLASLGLVPALSSAVASGTIGAGLGTGAAAGGAAAGAGAAGAGAGTAATAVGPALGAGLIAAPLIVPALGALLHPFFKQWDAESLGTRHHRRNEAVLEGMIGALTQATQQRQGDLGGLLGIANAGPQFGQGQIKFDWGGRSGGTYQEPMSPEYQQSLYRAASGDPQALRDFIDDVHISTGETGAVSPNEPLTDYYRRELARAGGITDLTGLVSPRMGLGQRAAAKALDPYVFDWQALQGFSNQGNLTGEWMPISSRFANKTWIPISDYGRQPGELDISPATLQALQAMIALGPKAYEQAYIQRMQPLPVSYA